MPNSAPKATDLIAHDRPIQSVAAFVDEKIRRN